MEHTPVVVAAEVNCQLAENPLWHAEKNCVYWTDIPAGKIYSLENSTKQARIIYSGESVGGFTLEENGDLILFRVKDIARLKPDGSVAKLRDFTDEGMHRFNDVIADPRGRVFAGTIGENPKAGLYRVDCNGTITKLFSGSACSNGMGFSPDEKQFYWTCTTRRTIFQFDYDAKSGALENQKVFYKTTSDEGIPDGLTVDAEGRVWSARWGGSSLIRHATDGTPVDRIQFPAAKISSVCFGGTGLNELFVTCAISEGETKNQFQGLFHTTVQVRGKNEFRSQFEPI